MKDLKISYEIIKFSIIGILTAVIQLILYKLMLEMKFYFELSSVISMIISTVLAYLGNRIWTFRSVNKFFKEFVSFMLVRGISILLNAILLFVFVEKVLMHKFEAQIVSIILITVINYIVSKIYIFKTKIN